MPRRMTQRQPAGDAFLWTPATGLSNPAIANPVGTYNVTDSIRYVVTATARGWMYGCGDLLVKVYGTGAEYLFPGFYPRRHE